MRRTTSSIKSLERSGPSCSPIAVEPTTSAISAVTMRRSSLVVTATVEFYRWPVGLPPGVNGDRKIQDDVVRRRQLGLEACQHLVRARRGGEKPVLDLLDGLEADELVRERLREAPAAEIPAIELLQEARRALLAHLRDGVAHEVEELGDDLLARGRALDDPRDLADGPGVPLRDTADHDGRAAGLGEDALGATPARDVARRDHGHVHELDELGGQRMVG